MAIAVVDNSHQNLHTRIIGGKLGELVGYSD